MDELELEYREIECFEPLEDIVISHEETLETVIPEYCPDLARIVDTSGQIGIREKYAAGGKAAVVGQAAVTVLYVSEESAGLKSLTLTIPLQCSAEEKRDVRIASAAGRIVLLEARMLAPRKLYVRLLAELHLTPVRRVSRRISTGVAEERGLKLLRRQTVVPLLTGIWEQTVSLSHTLPPEAGAEPAELLLCRPIFRAGSCQAYGNKVVVKGEVDLRLLLRGDEQRLYTREETVPFSQIVEGRELPEDAALQCICTPASCEVRPLRRDGSGELDVSAQIGLTVFAYVSCGIDYLADLYSTCRELTAVQDTALLPAAHAPEETRQTAVQRLDGAGDFLYMTAADCSAPVLLDAAPGRPAVRTELRMRFLYLDETGAPVSAERTCEVTADLASLPEGVRAAVEGESWQRSGAGYEVRVPVAFTLESRSAQEIRFVASAQQQESNGRENAPSLTLRRLRPGETLWDLAKACRADTEAILAVNALADESQIGEQLLLIPRQR